jgi:hypothetical protein
MNPAGSAQLPTLAVADFGPGLDHVAEVHQNGRLFAIVHKNDPVRQHLPVIQLDPNDPYRYVFVHGGQEFSRFENLQLGTHEIPADVVVSLLLTEYGPRLNGLSIRMCVCYGNMLRPGDTKTAVQRLAGLLPMTNFQGYHGLVYVDPEPPTVIRLGDAVVWDALSGPYYIDPRVPGQWEIVLP